MLIKMTTSVECRISYLLNSFNTGSLNQLGNQDFIKTTQMFEANALEYFYENLNTSIIYSPIYPASLNLLFVVNINYFSWMERTGKRIFLGINLLETLEVSLEPGWQPPVFQVANLNMSSSKQIELKYKF